MDKKEVAGKEEGVKDICVALKKKPETTAEESEVQNPLQNPLILHRILFYLNNLSDLKNCRLVHPTWKNEASNFLKKMSIIKISKEFLKTSKKDTICLKVLGQLKDFQPENLLFFPSPYRFPSNDYSSKNWDMIKTQIRKLRDGVKYLKFPNMKVTLPLGTQSFTEILDYKFPNLVQLVLGNSDFSWPNPPPPPIPTLKRIDWILTFNPSADEKPTKLKLMEGVFKLAPNLVTLKLKEEAYIWGLSPDRVSMYLDHFKSNPSSCPNLQHLHLDLVHLSPSDIEALSDLKINLRSLKLSRLPVIANQQIFEDFLKTQSGTLEKLRFSFPRNSLRPSNFVFPSLPTLKKLKLLFDVYDERQQPSLMKLENVDYAKQFPVLQKLVIKHIQSCCQVVDVVCTYDRIWLTCPVFRAFLPLSPENLDKEVCKTLVALKLHYPDQPELRLEDHFLFGIRERLSIKFPNVNNEHLNIWRARVGKGHPYWPSVNIPVCP